jgi:hypothetical protein
MKKKDKDSISIIDAFDILMNGSKEEREKLLACMLAEMNRHLDNITRNLKKIEV